MKKAYVKPIAYVEMFTPNQYAGNCQPGVSEKDLPPKTIDCWFHENTTYTYNVETYTFQANKSGCKKTTDGNARGCSNKGNTLSLLTNLCDVNFSGGGKYGDGVEVDYVIINYTTPLLGIPTSFVKAQGAMYAYPNGAGSYHYAMASDVLPGQSYDSNGIPYYFNS